MKYNNTLMNGLQMTITKLSSYVSQAFIAYANPYQIFGINPANESELTSLLIKCHDAEAAEFPDRDAQTLRKQLGSNQRFFGTQPYFDRSGFKETITHGKGFGVNNRNRDYLSIPPGFIVWFASIAIAYSSRRDLLIQYVQDGLFIPDVTREWLNKVRTADQPAQQITKLCLVSFETPTIYKNTLLDPSFLQTDEGFILFIEFLTFLGASPNNYVKGKFLSKTDDRPLPRASSGLQITHCALSTNTTSRYGTYEFVIAPFNSFPDEIKSIMVYDAVIAGSILMDKFEQPLNGNQAMILYQVDGLYEQQIFTYILCRVCKGMSNNSYIDGDVPEESPPPKKGYFNKNNQGVKQKANSSQQRDNKETAGQNKSSMVVGALGGYCLPLTISTKLLRKYLLPRSIYNGHLFV